MLTEVTNLGQFIGKQVANLYCPTFGVVMVQATTGEIYAWKLRTLFADTNATVPTLYTAIPASMHSSIIQMSGAVDYMSYSNSVSEKTYALLKNGTIYAAATSTYYTPTTGQWVQFPTSNVFITKLACGNLLTCIALASNGKYYSWGKNMDGRAGFKDISTSYTTVKILPNQVTDVYASDGMVSFISEQSSYAYGIVKQLFKFAGSTAGKSIVAMHYGGYHYMLQTSDGGLHVCGYGNWNGEEGTGSSAPRAVYDVPVAVQMNGALNGQTIKQIYAGYGYSLALTTSGKLYGWGKPYVNAKTQSLFFCTQLTLFAICVLNRITNYFKLVTSGQPVYTPTLVDAAAQMNITQFAAANDYIIVQNTTGALFAMGKNVCF